MKKLLLGTIWLSIIVAIYIAIFYIVSSDFRDSTILFIAAFATIYYVVETNGMKKEMVRQNEIHTQPFLLIYYRESGKRLTIRNAGKGLANKIEFNDTVFNFVDTGRIQLKFTIAGTHYLLPDEERELLVSGTDRNGAEITSSGFIEFLINPNEPAFDSGIQVRALDVSHVPYMFTIKIEKTGTYVSEVRKGRGNCAFE